MKTRNQNQLGLAAIEFVLVLPVLLLLAFSIIDFGRLLFQYDALTKSTRDAAKYVARAVKPASNALATELSAYNTIVEEAQRLALCGDITLTNPADCASNALVQGLSASNISVDYPAASGGISYVRVKVDNYSNNYITNVLGVSKSLATISVTMRQVQQ